MNEFKLNYYFEMYKNTLFNNAREFKNEFIKKHGQFPYLNELVIMIANYQTETYGNRVTRRKK